MRHFNPNHVAEVAASCRSEIHTPRQRQILDNFIEHASACVMRSVIRADR